MAEAVTTYLYELMALPDVTASRQFLSLLNDHDGAGGAESSGMVPENAVDFLLQPCSFTSLYVARRVKHEEEIEVPAGSTVLWRFFVGDGLDIQFKATFCPHPPATAPAAPATDDDASSPPSILPSPPFEPPSLEILMEGRFPSSDPQTAPPPSPTKPGGGGGGPEYVQGSYTSPPPSLRGICCLTWDNAFSRLRGKQVQYVLQVVREEAMQAAVEAAEELLRASSRTRNLITSRIQAGEGGSEGGKVCVTVTPVARPAVDSAEAFGSSSPSSGEDGGGEEGVRGGEI